MSLKSAYARKDTLWVSPTPGIEVEVSFFDPRSPGYIAEVQRITKPVRKLAEAGLLPPDKDRAYAAKAFAAYCVKGWRSVDENGDVTNADSIEVEPGKMLSFSPDAAADVFVAYPAFYSDVVDLARDVGSFKLTENERGN